MSEATQYVNILKQADIFYKLTPAQLEMISGVCQEKTFHTGEVVLAEGAASDELYVIAEGEIAIQVNPALVREKQEDDLHPATIATLRRGQSFGEVALVDHGLRSATAKAIQDKTRVLIIAREKLILLCETYPQLGYRLMKNLAADLALKLRTTDLLIREELLYAQTRKTSPLDV